MAQVKVTRYQVNTSFLAAGTYLWVNLYDDTNTQVGRIEIKDLAQLPLLEFALDRVRSGNTVTWTESGKALSFGTKQVGAG